LPQRVFLDWLSRPISNFVIILGNFLSFSNSLSWLLSQDKNLKDTSQCRKCGCSNCYYSQKLHYSQFEEFCNGRYIFSQIRESSLRNAKPCWLRARSWLGTRFSVVFLYTSFLARNELVPNMAKNTRPTSVKLWFEKLIHFFVSLHSPKKRLRWKFPSNKFHKT